MLMVGMALMVMATVLAALDLFGVARGAGGLVTLAFVGSLVVLLTSGIRSSMRGHHWRHRHLH